MTINELLGREPSRARKCITCGVNIHIPTSTRECQVCHHERTANDTARPTARGRTTVSLLRQANRQRKQRMLQMLLGMERGEDG